MPSPRLLTIHEVLARLGKNPPNDNAARRLFNHLERKRGLPVTRIAGGPAVIEEELNAWIRVRREAELRSLDAARYVELTDEEREIDRMVRDRLRRAGKL